MYFETNNLNVSVEACNFANNYAGVVKIYLALQIEWKGVVCSLSSYIPSYVSISVPRSWLGGWAPGSQVRGTKASR